MAKHWWSVVACTLAGFTIIAASAQPVAQKPLINIGDAWEFSATSTPDGKQSKWSRTVIELAPNEVLKVRLQDDKVSDFDSVMNFMPEGRSDYVRVLVKYPLKVGDEWEMSRKFPNPGTLEQGKAKVVAQETITVSAGTFTCYRVEAVASLTNKSYRENRSWKRWYCPDVKWVAKEILETSTFNPYNPAATGTTVLTSELVKFTPGK